MKARILAICTCLALGALALPGTAAASSVSVEPCCGPNAFKTTYTAAPGEVNDVWTRMLDGDRLVRIKDRGVLLMGVPINCTTELYATTCAGLVGWLGVAAAPLELDAGKMVIPTFRLGDGDDRIQTQTSAIVHGDEGDDELRSLTGSAFFHGGPGADLFIGQSGSDFELASYADHAGPIRLTLDGVADDGSPGEGDNVLPSMDGGDGTPGDDVFIGTDTRNYWTGPGGTDYVLGLGGGDLLHIAAEGFADGGDGDDFLDMQTGVGGGTLRGGTGNDRLSALFRPVTLEGGDGDDSILAYGGGAATITCGPGNDFVRADTTDVIATDCERVVIAN